MPFNGSIDLRFYFRRERGINCLYSSSVGKTREGIVIELQGFGID